jgi:dolichol-phosphate mannosyltransferase
MQISLVIPVYNEELIIPALFERTREALTAFTEDFEVILVNDGSADRTLEHLLECRAKDARFKVLDLSRNFGHQSAILAGLSYAKGACIGIMDGDLQDPPELFARFYHKLEEGYDVVYAVRKKRKEGRFKRGAYWLYYRILANIAGMRFPVDSGDFSLMRKRVVDEMLRLPEQSLFIRGLRFWVGFRQTGLEYERDERLAGEPKYNLRRLYKLATNGIYSFSDFPIRLMGQMGSLTVFVTVSYSIYILSKKILWGEIPEGFTTLILAIFFFGGVQLISIRILGEYVSRIYDQSRNRPLFIVKDAYL